MLIISYHYVHCTFLIYWSNVYPIFPSRIWGQPIPCPILSSQHPYGVMFVWDNVTLPLTFLWRDTNFIVVQMTPDSNSWATRILFPVILPSQWPFQEDTTSSNYGLWRVNIKQLMKEHTETFWLIQLSFIRKAFSFATKRKCVTTPWLCLIYWNCAQNENSVISKRKIDQPETENSHAPWQLTSLTK